MDVFTIWVMKEGQWQLTKNKKKLVALKLCQSAKSYILVEYDVRINNTHRNITIDRSLSLRIIMNRRFDGPTYLESSPRNRSSSLEMCNVKLSKNQKKIQRI